MAANIIHAHEPIAEFFELTDNLCALANEVHQNVLCAVGAADYTADFEEYSRRTSLSLDEMERFWATVRYKLPDVAHSFDAQAEYERARDCCLAAKGNALALLNAYKYTGLDAILDRLTTPEAGTYREARLAAVAANVQPYPMKEDVAFSEVALFAARDCYFPLLLHAFVRIEGPCYEPELLNAIYFLYRHACIHPAVLAISLHLAKKLAMEQTHTDPAQYTDMVFAIAASGLCDNLVDAYCRYREKRRGRGNDGTGAGALEVAEVLRESALKQFSKTRRKRKSAANNTLD